jgi:hypothetical protein
LTTRCPLRPASRPPPADPTLQSANSWSADKPLLLCRLVGLPRSGFEDDYVAVDRLPVADEPLLLRRLVGLPRGGFEDDYVAVGQLLVG